MNQAADLSYEEKEQQRIQYLRNELWGLASKIFALDPDELKILEKELLQKKDRPINDVMMIRISQIVRKYHGQLSELEEKSRMARITAMHPVTVKRDMTPEMKIEDIRNGGLDYSGVPQTANRKTQTTPA